MHRYSFKSESKMDCGNSMLKYILFIFNFIFWVFSLAILILGVIYKLQIHSAIKYLGDEFPVAPDLFITVGTVGFVISFFGCYGAWKENRCFLLMFVCLLIILLIIELGLVIIALIGISNNSLINQMKNTMNNELCSGELSQIERNLECCGVLGPDDYSQTSHLCLQHLIPNSCYKDANRNTDPYKQGCYDKLYDTFQKIGVQLGAIGITVAIMQVLGVASALFLSAAIKKNQF